MKLVMLDKITEDALSDMDDSAGVKFKGRMDYFRACIG
ncbi:hypothetical protein CSB86_6972 [Pseudomonas aeruginosa]|nr:hypothetical protein CSB86_6972 [Pseudomonas aeruginosa]